MRFQWLKDYQELEEQILYLKWNLNKSNLELRRWTSGDLSNVRLEKNSRSSSLEENIGKIVNEIALLETQKEELILLIESFKGVENEIVKMKYIQEMNLEDIAEETGYSASYIRKKHAEIRSKLNFLDDYESKSQSRRDKESEIDYYKEKERKQLSLF